MLSVAVMDWRRELPANREQQRIVNHSFPSRQPGSGPGPKTALFNPSARQLAEDAWPTHGFQTFESNRRNVSRENSCLVSLPSGIDAISTELFNRNRPLFSDSPEWPPG